MGGNGVRTHVNYKGKIPSTGRKTFYPEEDRTHDAASSRTTSPKSYSGPFVGGGGNGGDGVSGGGVGGGDGLSGGRGGRAGHEEDENDSHDNNAIA